MTDRTRKEAIAEAETEVLRLTKQGLAVKYDDTRDDEIKVYWEANGKWLKKSFRFTPPKPEFEKGTFGKFDGGGGTEVYGILDYIRGNLYFSQQNICAEIFTPIYQTDPIEKLAFELACARADIGLRSTDGIMTHFLSQAKKELENNG